jgi:hypothetical protein
MMYTSEIMMRVSPSNIEFLQLLEKDRVLVDNEFY